jgi:transcriptional regulator with XRE-family HTH domain
MENNFRVNLRNELNYQGVTVKELSARTDIPISTLDCYLGTRATVPSVDSAIKIAQALRVSVEYLVIGENTGIEQSQYKLSQEAQEIMHWIKGLNTEQCKAIIKTLKLLSIPLQKSTTNA